MFTTFLAGTGITHETLLKANNMEIIQSPVGGIVVITEKTCSKIFDSRKDFTRVIAFDLEEIL
jgi:hypothetical protein